MSEQTMVEQLQAARRLVAAGWTRHVNWRIDGIPVQRPEYIAAREAGEKCNCCVLGALIVVTNGAVDAAAAPLQQAMPEYGRGRLHNINDRMRSKKQVLAWIDRAIEIAKEDER